MSRRRTGRARGQSVVEFALVAPLMLIVLAGIFDLSRVYTTMMSVESAAREAADFGTTLGADRWHAGSLDVTVAEMRRRACIAASDLPDFEGVDADHDGVFEDCTNPRFEYTLTPTAGAIFGEATLADPCDDPSRNPPCTVTVTLHHVFHLLVPFQIDFFGVQLGLPVTLPFDRDSTFAMTDIEVQPSPTP